jgi:hypothetical protein
MCNLGRFLTVSSTGGVAQVAEHLFASVKPLVHTPVPQKKKKSLTVSKPTFFHVKGT